MVSIAFFDLDRTLIACNSAMLWLREEVVAGNVSAKNALRGAWILARYHLGATDLEEAFAAGLATMRGRKESEIHERICEFYHRVVVSKYRPKAKEVLETHRRNGDRLILLTSSSKYLSELVARDLDLDDYLCTLLEVDSNGLFTGQPLGRLCFSEGKLVAAKACVTRYDTSLSEAYFYTDSAADVPVLEAVGNPVAVNPDLRLSRLAKKRRWPVVDWGVPA